MTRRAVRGIAVVLASMCSAAGAVESAHAQPAPPPARHASLPAASPDGRWIAYARQTGPDSCEIRILRADGSEDRLVARVGAQLCLPGWASGGMRVTYALSGRDTSTLTSLALDGTDARVLARGPQKSFAFSPNGKRLAFTTGTWTRGRVVVADADGGRARALTDSAAGWFNLAWSPDGRTLAGTRLDTTGALQVWLVDARSGHSRALTDFAASDGRPQWPAWSPDGKRIALQAGHHNRDEPSRDEADIWVVTVASGQAARLTSRERPWMDETPTWLADGRHLVIQSTRTGPFELWRISDDGREAVQLTGR